MGKYNLELFNEARSYNVKYIDYDKVVTPELLLKIRKRNNLTQARLANILNVSKNLVCKWENGEEVIDGSSAVLIYLLDRMPGIISLLIEEYNG